MHDKRDTMNGTTRNGRAQQPFARIWETVPDPREQMQLAVLYLVIRRDLDGHARDRDRLADVMERHHGWPADRTRGRADRLKELGLLDGGTA